MSETLTESARELFDGKNYAVMATIEPDGQPQQSLVWVKTDGDDVLVSTTIGRRKERNLSRDPRATLLVYPSDNPYRYVEVRGSVTLTEQGGPELIQELAHRYTGGPFTADTPETRRVVVRLRPSRVRSFG
jgi:PPOX class probable F420-dependent enzyme